jgi:hypothetical protein
MDHSSTLASTVTGGVLQSTIQTMPGTASCITPMAMSTGTTSIRKTGCLFVASGINLFVPMYIGIDNLII